VGSGVATKVYFEDFATQTANVEWGQGGDVFVGGKSMMMMMVVVVVMTKKKMMVPALPCPMTHIHNCNHKKT
jgi:hypothetical protein